LGLRLPVSLSGKPRKTFRFNQSQEIGPLRLVWQNTNNLDSNSDPQSCVSFDREPSLAFHNRDRALNDHWRPVKQGSKIDEYFGLFSLKSYDLQVFWHVGEANSGMAGFCYDDEGWIVYLLDFM